MASDSKIVIELAIEEAGAKVTLQQVNDELSKLSKTSSDYKSKLEEVSKAENNLSRVRRKISAEVSNQYKQTARTVDGLKQHIRSLREVQSATATTNKSFLSYELRIKEAQEELQKLTATQNKFIPANGKMGKSVGGLNGRMTTLKDNTGSASAAAMELGRVVSDAPYGIRGMANNVSQLASQLFYMAGQQAAATTATTAGTKATVASTVASNADTLSTAENATAKTVNSTAKTANNVNTKAGTTATTASTVATNTSTVATEVATVATVGFTGALKLMWKALMGPLGILLGIQAVIAAIDYFYGANTKAEKSSKSLADEVTNSVGTFKRLNTILQHNTTSIDDKKKALEQLKREYPEAIELVQSYYDNIESGNANVEESIRLEKEYTKIIIEEGKKRAAIKKVDELSGELLELEIERNEGIEESRRDLDEALSEIDDEALVRKIKNTADIVQTNYDTTKSYEDQSSDVKAAMMELLNAEEYGGSELYSAIVSGISGIEELNKTIAKYAMDSGGIFDGAKKAAQELADLMFKLDKDTLQHTVDINNAIIADDNTKYSEKKRLINENYKISKSIIDKERVLRTEDIDKRKTDTEKDQTDRRASLLKFNRDHLKLQVKLRDQLAALDKGGRRERISPFKTPAELDLEVESNINAIDKLNYEIAKKRLANDEKQALYLTQTGEERLAVERDFEEKNLQLEIDYKKKALESKRDLELQDARDDYQKYVDGLDAKLQAYKDRLNATNNTLTDAERVQIKIASDAVKERRNQAGIELGFTIEEIKAKYGELFPLYHALAQAAKKALEIGDDSEDLDLKIQKFQNFAEMSSKVMSTIGDFAASEFERELTIEQNKTTALNNELNKRLDNQNLSKEQRKNIQNQIAKNDEQLRIKQNAIEKKKFKMQKAVNIATALMDTASAAAGVMAQAKGGFFTRLAQAIPTIAFGLAQVAMIARQKYQAPAMGGGSTGGGGSGDGEDKEDVFNIVGQSQGSQLAGAIQGQFDKPLKAYVVARDVTNQQGIDSNIEGNASIGG